MPSASLHFGSEVADALHAGRPVVALESTLVAHGLPWPVNLATARAAEQAVRGEGAVPATIAVWQGRLTVGLSDAEVEALARSAEAGSGLHVRKASRRDLAAAVVQKATAATTVSATLLLAHRAGVRVLATGGIGGVHPALSPPRRLGGDTGGSGQSFDVSADLPELARTPVAVVCAGAKSILDLAATLEMLETLAVPVVGVGTSDFPAFYLRSSGHPVAARVETAEEAAALVTTHWQLGGAGVVLALPLPAETALHPAALATALRSAEDLARAGGISGPALTPFLLARLAEATGGETLRANHALIVANARFAARVARSLSTRP
jgi:pseudouridine-5'-phosphate glycosidase